MKKFIRWFIIAYLIVCGLFYIAGCWENHSINPIDFDFSWKQILFIAAPILSAVASAIKCLEESI